MDLSPNNGATVFYTAITLYDRALSVDPKNVNVLNNKGIVLIKLGKYKESIFYFEKALSIKSNSVGALYNEGKALDGLQRHNEAMIYYAKASSIDPNYSGQLFNNILTAEGKILSTYRSAA